MKTDIVGVEEDIDHGESKLVVPLLRYSGRQEIVIVKSKHDSQI